MNVNEILPNSVLLIESDPDAAVAILKILDNGISNTFDVVNSRRKTLYAWFDTRYQNRQQINIEWVKTMSDATEILARQRSDIILLSAELSDYSGFDTLFPIMRLSPDSLLVVVSETYRKEAAQEAIQGGAADYLLKSQLSSEKMRKIYELLIAKKSVKKTISDSDTYFRKISDGSPLGIVVTDAEERCVYSNTAYHQISGVNCDRNPGVSWYITIHPDDKVRALDDWQSAALDKKPFHSEIRYVRKDGSIVWARLNTAAMYSGSRLTGHIQTVEDITERKLREFRLAEAEEALFAEKERAQVTLNSIGDAVLATDREGRVSYMNLVAEAMTGWSSADAIGKLLTDVFHIVDGDTRVLASNPAITVIAEDRNMALSSNCILIRKDGSECHIEDTAAPIHDREGQVTGAVIVFHDISVSRAMALKMSHMAQHDALTGLPNRAMLTERLAQTIGLAHRHDKQLGIMYLDLDLFKHVNDSLGHNAGDLLLKSVAKRLTDSVRTTDTVCRQGGDEFVILLADMVHPQDAARIAENLLQAFSRPHIIQGNHLYVTLSIGISIYPDDGQTADAVMHNADLAMYHAKENGRNNFQFFTDEMNQRAVHRLSVVNGLRTALEQKAFELYYQPKFNLITGAISGAEALIRWHEPDAGIVSPDYFIEIAEESGLIVPIGQWVMLEACRQVKNWLDAGLVAVPVAINVSAVEFRHRNFIAGVASALNKTGLSPQYLELELTESSLMDCAESSVTVLDALKAMGVTLALDDFGTGYSSLSYLKRFPISTLKIDQSFVQDVVTDKDDATIVSAVIGMGKNLNQKVIAEGVETAQQLAFLKDRHCDEGQGNQLGSPLTAVDFGDLLAQRQPV